MERSTGRAACVPVLSRRGSSAQRLESTDARPLALLLEILKSFGRRFSGAFSFSTAVVQSPTVA